jgi:predicted 2-oxoglutarate/Fe(II)-dependent dioxygenase YbiX
MTLRFGHRLPFCAGVYGDQRFYAADVQAGRAAVMVLGALLRSPNLPAVCAALADLAPDFAALDADVLVLGGLSEAPAAWLSGPDTSGLPIVLCNDNFFTDCGLAPGVDVVVVIDRAWRVLGGWPTQDCNPAALAEAALGAVRAIPREDSSPCRLPAPVLSVPSLFDTDLCRRLIAHFEAGGQFDSGVSGIGSDGTSRERLDHTKKRRTDCLLQAGDGLYEEVLEALYARCAPAIKQAFQCHIAHNDRVLIARYDESGGYFKRHRDNMHEGVAFRQFAISVNLNTGDYDGGQLMFPEFNDHLHGPEAGGAIVFSTSLLHEATPVTRGQRYVLLTFFHDAEAEQRRLAYEQARLQRMLDEGGTPQ